MAKKTLADAQAEIEELRRQLAEAQSGGADDAAPVGEEFPKAMYRSAKVTEQRPQGYEVRRVNNEEEQAALGDEWKESPDDLVATKAGRRSAPKSAETDDTDE
jgi:hypothetical protein